MSGWIPDNREWPEHPGGDRGRIGDDQDQSATGAEQGVQVADGFPYVRNMFERMAPIDQAVRFFTVVVENGAHDDGTTTGSCCHARGLRIEIDAGDDPAEL